MRVARARRTAPFVDLTRYTSWNGMLAGALIRAGAMLEDDWSLQHGLSTLRRIRGEQIDPAALLHSPGGVGGLLDDQVQVALAAIEAYEATGQREWLDWSGALMERVWADYLDRDGGGLFDSSAHTGEGLLPTRVKPVQDAPTPSPNGVAALCAARLTELTGEPRWAERRDALVRTFAGSAVQLGVFGATFLQALEWSVRPATHLVIVEGSGADAVAAADNMHRQALQSFFPRRVLHRVMANGAASASLPAAVRGMLGANSGTRAYACIGATCQAPATSPAAWAATLGGLKSLTS
jgi:hypothetical protein